MANPANEADPSRTSRGFGTIGGEPREEEARVRGPSVRSGARWGLARGNGGRVEEDDVRTRKTRPRGLWSRPGSQSAARAQFSRLNLPPPFDP